MRLATVALMLLCASRCGTDVGRDAGFAPLDAATSGDDAAPGPDVNGVIFVDSVHDGDTVRVRAGAAVLAPDGRSMNGERIRLLGVDAPEVEPPECFGTESRDFLRSHLDRRVVTLVFDERHGLRDAFGRLLAYVLVDGVVANEESIRRGQSQSYRAFAHRDRDRYNALEQEARSEAVGLWSTCR